MDEPRILTVGHSNHPIERFLALVQGAGVSALADVRSFPISRYAPQFNKDALAKSLAEKAIVYLYCGEELGGRSRDPSTLESFRKGLDRVVAESARHRVALMCEERDPLDCHREPARDRRPPACARGTCRRRPVLARGEADRRLSRPPQPPAPARRGRVSGPWPSIPRSTRRNSKHFSPATISAP
jgi:hypothetical protein